MVHVAPRHFLMPRKKGIFGGEGLWRELIKSGISSREMKKGFSSGLAELRADSLRCPF